MPYDDIESSINMYEDLLKNLDSPEDDDTIKFCKSEIKRLESELQAKANIPEQDNTYDLIHFYRKLLQSEELEPEKRTLYLNEITRLENTLNSIENSTTRAK